MVGNPVGLHTRVNTHLGYVAVVRYSIGFSNWISHAVDQVTRLLFKRQVITASRPTGVAFHGRLS